MSTEEIRVDNDDHTNEGYPIENESQAKASIKDSEEVSAHTGEDANKDKGSDEEGDKQDGTAEQAPQIPIEASKTEDRAEDEDEDEDDSDDDNFPINEDAPRGRVVGPVAGQRPPKPR
ncbi:hypothetical protein JR316_0009017 [Psilocybe cubensis]|uniref:Uncharacterized protein n=2 Tax=Psilocybe cubensis TaxID=181762 RepID=A0ACB8GSW0_PSICU|nr:hypothetical protein JR316_0009017 [Psilocybe cubensis]KAH9478560.1 hypothetical protein JR316_0009017 [Psilocybe cubensis]